MERLRKRSARLSETDSLGIEEPPKKKYRRRTSPAMDKPKSRRRKGDSSSSCTPPSKLAAGSSGRGPRSLTRQGKKLLVSLNIQDNDLQVGRGGSGTAAVSAVSGKLPGRQRGGARSRQSNQRRDQSVTSDTGSSNGVSNGKYLTFKNPNFSVEEMT